MAAINWVVLGILQISCHETGTYIYYCKRESLGTTTSYSIFTTLNYFELYWFEI